MNKRRNSSSSL